ncbi:hypothetical protein Droror1_Dr00026074 [Drosera rotundifolia]
MAPQMTPLKRTQSMKTSTPSKNSHLGSVSRVRVVVRVRPFLARQIASEKGGQPVSCVSVLDSEAKAGNEVVVCMRDQETRRSDCYMLDGFFGPEETNIPEIFAKEVMPLIHGIFRGCNGTVFAYGATGSGKTYTMQGTDENPGLMPLAMCTILSMCETTVFTAKVSYYEVYMDKCHDLLELKPNEIAVFDDEEGRVHLKGLSEVPVSSMHEFHEVLSRGIQLRRVAHTGLNDVSSRSHGVLVIAVYAPSVDGLGTRIAGKLNLIDLAGNEDNRRSCNEGIRLQESAKNNQSLLALSNVIYALNNNQSRVPYRDSKLTRILQDSLGGTSHAAMVACLNPGTYLECRHTVSIAARSRHVTNMVASAQKHEVPNMETKLHAWLESKGRTKSVQRNEAIRSPPFSRTPSSLRKQAPSLSSKKENTVFRNVTMENDRSTTTSQRMLSLELAPSDVNIEEGYSCDVIEYASPLRMALCPLNSNITSTPNKELSSCCKVSTETPFVSTRDKYQDFGTPLDKFTARSSAMKNFLADEYIDFLNAASREELMELKGIGAKRAKYIIDLRETGPLKSLSDLEKIGLSSKQIHHIFNLVARGIFKQQNIHRQSSPDCLDSFQGALPLDM